MVRIGCDTKELEAKLGKANTYVQKHAEQFKKVGRVATVAGATIVGALGLTVKSAIRFNQEMANISTLIPRQTKRVLELKKVVQDLAMVYGTSTADIAQGLYQVISAFGDTADTAKILEINVKGAAAGMATTTEAIDLTSAVTKAYGDTSAEAVQKVMDLAFQTVKLGQTTFPELAGSIGKVTPLAKELNLSQEELFGTFATLTGVTGDAAKVSTQFSGVLGSMIKPTEGMGEAMVGLGKKIGLGEDATAKAIIAELGFKGALVGLKDQTDGTTVGLGKLFESKEALVGLLPLLSTQSEVYNKKLREMANSVGITDEAFKEMSEGINKTGFDMKKLKEMVLVLSQRLGDQLAPMIGSVAVAAGKVVQKIIAWVKENPKLTGTLIKIVAVLGGLATVLGPLLVMLPGIVTALPAIALGLHALLGPLGAVTIAAAAAYKIISKLTKAKSDLVDADYRAFEAEHKLGQKLREATDAAGLSRAEFHQLSLKYDENTAALASAIMKGKEGKELQEALAKVGKKHKKVIDEQKAALNKVKSALEGAAEGQAKLEKAVKTTSEAIENDFGRAGRDMSDVIERIGTSISTTTIPAMRDLTGITYNVQESLQDLTMEEREFGEESERVTKEVRSFWDEMADGLQTKWASTIGEVLRGATSLKDGLKGTWDAIVVQFTDMIGAMGAKWTVNFVGGIISSATTAGDAIADNIGGAMEGVQKGLGAVGTAFANFASGGLASGIGSAIGTFLGTVIAGTADMDATNRELHNIWAEARNILNNVDNMKWNQEELKKIGWETTNLLGTLKNAAWERNKILATNLGEMVKVFKGINFGQHGLNTTVAQPTLFMAGEAGVEHVNITPASFGRADSVNIAMTIEIEPVVIPRGDEYVIEFLQKSIKRGNIRIPIESVG